MSPSGGLRGRRGSILGTAVQLYCSGGADMTVSIFCRIKIRNTRQKDEDQDIYHDNMLG